MGGSTEMSFSGLPNREANALEGRRLLKLSRRRILLTITMAALLGLGMFLRIFPSSGFKRVGFDEHGYMVFVKQIQAAGVGNYDAVVKVYVERQFKRPGAVVPATRLAFLAPAAVIGEVLQ